jgi:hypothetical protein
VNVPEVGKIAWIKPWNLKELQRQNGTLISVEGGRRSKYIRPWHRTEGDQKVRLKIGNNSIINMKTKVI